MRIFKRFRTDQTGATAMLFGLALIPLTGLMGAAVDYSRAANEHSKLQRAIDAAVLALVKEPRSATAGQLQSKGAKVFATLYQPTPGVTMGKPTVSRQGNTVSLSAAGTMPNAFMQVAGFKTVAVGAEATAAWGTERIELALVLDSTGSMNNQIGSKRKIDELKSSAGKLIDELKLIAVDKDDVRVSVVPFDTEVRVDPAKYRYGNWQRWENGASAERNAWTGYVIDRYQPNDITDVAPALSLPDTLYPKLQTSQWASSGHLAFVQPLVSLHQQNAADQVKATINSMQPRGNTNVGLGVSWGVATLTGSIPLDSPASADPRTVKRYMIVLTDGDNTQKWVNGVRKNIGSGSNDPVQRMIDERTGQACTMAKDPKGAKTEVFTIRLLAGDVALLQGCASPPNDKVAQHYFDVQSEAGLSAAFRAILSSINGTRLTN